MINKFSIEFAFWDDEQALPDSPLTMTLSFEVSAKSTRGEEFLHTLEEGTNETFDNFRRSIEEKWDLAHDSCGYPGTIMFDIYEAEKKDALALMEEWRKFFRSSSVLVGPVFIDDNIT